MLGWVCVDLCSNDGKEVIADQSVDFLDAQKIPGLGIWMAFDGDGEFVVATKGGHGWLAGGGVGAEG